MKNLAKRVIMGITPPIITSCIWRFREGTRASVEFPDSDRDVQSDEYLNSDRNVRSDEYIRWLCWIQGGFLTSDHGNLIAFDYAVRHMPVGGAIVEIGSFLGLSTNIITYLTIKYHRDNPLFACDPWVFEGTDKPVGGYFDASSEAFREYVTRAFIVNTALFSRERKPYAIEAFSDQFFELWRICATTEDVFGRRVAFGGPISFAYIDGAHTYDAAKGDFLGADQHLLPGGFILFDDSADDSDWGVTRVVAEVKRDPSYELVFKRLRITSLEKESASYDGRKTKA
jgi:hypothetical protein